MEESPKIDLEKNKEKFFNFDERTNEEKEHQENIIEALSSQNRKLFSCETQKKKSKIQKSFPHLIQTLKFSDGWYVKYTDNLTSHSHFEYKMPMMTIHGCPGYYEDWLGLENAVGPNQFRIINFFVPGFDNNPENDRGDYDSSMDNVSLLIIRLLDHLKINRVIFLIHSMGGYLMFYFCQRFRERVSGLVYMAAPSINWYVGFVVFYGIMVSLSKMNRHINEIVLLKNKKYRKFLVNYLRKSVSEINMEGVAFPHLNENEICAFIKLFSSIQNVSNVYSYSKDMPKVLKLLACGKNDPINEFDKFVESFYYNIFGKGKIEDFKKEVKEEIKRSLQKNKEFSQLELNFDDLQRNFVFTFSKTGHNVHRKRCNELARPLRCYVAIIEVIEEIRERKMPKL